MMDAFDQRAAAARAIARLPALHLPPGASPTADMNLRVRGGVLVEYMKTVYFRDRRYMMDSCPRLRYTGVEWRNAVGRGASLAIAIKRAQREESAMTHMPTDTPFHEGDAVTITEGNFKGKRGVVARVSYGRTIYYEVHNADEENDPFPPIYLSDTQMEAASA